MSRQPLKKVSIEEYKAVAPIGAYLAREDGYILMGLYEHRSPGLTIRVPDRMPKRAIGNSNDGPDGDFVNLVHWLDFYPFQGVKTTEENTWRAKCLPGVFDCLPGVFDSDEMGFRGYKTFTVKHPRNAKDLLVGPIYFMEPIDTVQLARTLEATCPFVHPIIDSDVDHIERAYVVIPLGGRIDKECMELVKPTQKQIDADRKMLSNEYETWLQKELCADTPNSSSTSKVKKPKLHRSKDYKDKLSELDYLIERNLNSLSDVRHKLTIGERRLIYDDKMFDASDEGLEALSKLVNEQFSRTIQAQENIAEVFEAFKALDTAHLVENLKLEIIHSPTNHAFVLRNPDESDGCFFYQIRYADEKMAMNEDYGEVLSLPPRRLASKIWIVFEPIIEEAYRRHVAVKLLEEADRCFCAEHVRAKPTQSVEPGHYL